MVFMREAISIKMMNNGHHTGKSTGNTHYTGEIAPLPYPKENLSATTLAAQLLSDGYALLPKMLTPDEVATWRSRMDAMGSQNDDDYIVPGWCYNKHVGMDFTEDAYHAELIDKSPLVDIAELALAGGDDGNLRVIGGSYWITGAGRAMGLHIDWLPVAGLPESVHDTPGFQMPIFIATAHYYLQDTTLEYGPTMLIPGSHKAGRPPVDENTWNENPPQAAIVKAGDVVIFRGDLWHGAWKNTHPTEKRYMIQVHYAHGYIRPVHAYGTQGAPPLTHPTLYKPEVIEALTPRQRQLLGG
jgi:hypothetical protein